MVWDASRVQVEPDCAPPALDELESWLSSRPNGIPSSVIAVFLARTTRTASWPARSLARNWQVTGLWLMITGSRQSGFRPRRGRSAAPRCAGSRAVSASSRALPAASVEQFDRYDDLRSQAAARLAFGGFDGDMPMAMADMYLRGDIAVIEDVATLKRARGAWPGTRGRRGRHSAGAPRGRARRPTCSPPPRSPAASTSRSSSTRSDAPGMPAPPAGRAVRGPVSGGQTQYPQGVCAVSRELSRGMEETGPALHRPKISVREALRRDGTEGDVRRHVRARRRAARNRGGARHRRMRSGTTRRGCSSPGWASR